MQLQRSPQPFDPIKLPHKTLKPNKDNKPKLKQEEFAQAGLHNTPFPIPESDRLQSFENDAPPKNRIAGDRKSTRLNSSHTDISRMPSSA